jgi:hypothetical protein
VYRLAEYFRWEPQHNGEKVKDFKENIRRLEVPLNFFFMLFLRWSSPEAIRTLLEPFGVNREAEIGHLRLEPLIDTEYAQPDVRVESESARIYIEIKRKGGKIDLQQVQKYLLLHAEMDERFGEKEPFLFFLTPNEFARHWSPRIQVSSNVPAFLEASLQAPLGKLEQRVTPKVLDRYESVRAAVRYGAATWKSISGCLVSVREQYKLAGRSDAELSIISDFVAELERRESSGVVVRR